MLRQVGQFKVHSSPALRLNSRRDPASYQIGGRGKFIVKARELFLCLLCAGLLILSFPGFNIWPAAWFAFVPLFFLLQNKSKLKAFLLAYLTGVLFWAGAIYWLVHVTLLGTVILILYLALFFGFFGLIFSTMNYEHRTMNYFLIPSVWVLLEYARSQLLTGFPWALLGYSQHLNLTLIQIADIMGAWGVSFLVMMGNVVIYSLIAHRLSFIHAKKKYLLLPVLCLAFTLGYGYYKLHRTPNTEHQASLKISIVQANIPQELKWDPQAREYILSQYARLTEKASQGKPDLIIWPEAANPDVSLPERDALEEISSLAQRQGIPLLFGSVIETGVQYFNSALLLSTNGEIASRYDKLHLVPFGEYIPLRSTFPFLETIAPIGDITAGREYTLFEIQNPKSKIQNKFGVLICFEDLFPELSRQFVKRGAQFLVNITNDAWYKKTAAASQHFQASVFRAVENRIFLVRSANTGVSGFINPQGRVISVVRDTTGQDIFVEGFGTQEIAGKDSSFTFYALHGDFFILVLFIFVAARLTIPAYRQAGARRFR
ncbi:MAG: apolipoprotein N-acyltransferase [Candidatus Omnitrophota bacterium]